jgi:hypothetical protein
VPKLKKTSDKATPDNEHIFPQTKLTPLAIRWKELNAASRHTEAMLLLEEIIILSTPMFERLAQHEEYHNTVDLGILVSAAQEKVIKWLLKWEPRKGRLFSWFSKCAKHAFLSELVKANQYRKRFHVTGDNMEPLYGDEDHEVDKHNLAEEFNRGLKDLYCRWGSPQEIGAIQYLVECLVHDLDNHDKQGAIRATAYAWGIAIETAKFFYQWTLTALRDLHYARVRVPFTEEDIIRHAQSYTNFVDLYDFMSHDEIKRLIATHGGQRIKIPTIAQITKLKEDYQIFREIDSSNKDPDSIGEIAKKHKRTPRTATEAYYAMIEATNPNRSGEHAVYDEHQSG